MLIILVSLCILLINIPFGYWRNNVKKFSLQWFLSIHIPIPFIILARIYTDLGFAWYTYFFTVLSFFMGQLMGKTIHEKLKLKNVPFLGSSIFIDLYRNLKFL